MKTVDIILSGRINAIMGPVATLKRILKNRDYFADRGYQVNVFTFDSIDKGPFDDIYKVPTSRVKAPKLTRRMKISSHIRKLSMKSKLLTDIIVWKNNRKTQKLIDYYLSLHRNPDIVECHSHYDETMYLKKCKSPSAKTVVFLHSDGIPYKMELYNFPKLGSTCYFKKLKKQCDWMLSRVDLVAFIANIGQKNFLELYPNRTREDTVVIRNGIEDLDTEQLAVFNGIKNENRRQKFKYRLCSVGTISYRKGQRFIIEALHTLPIEMLKDIHVDFIGDGAERPILEDLVQKYKLEANITFCGGVPNVEVYKYLAQNNIYILMSKNEGLPISILEAMRIGLPIIATNVSGIPECIDEGHNGFLIEPDSRQLAGLLKKLPEYDWEQMGRNSRDKFEREFTFDRMKKEFCDMFDKLTNNQVKK